MLRPAPAIPTPTVVETSPAAELPTIAATIVAAPTSEDADHAVSADFPILSTPAAEEDGIVQSLVVKSQTKSLIQEIEVLREKLESFQIRDRERFEPTSGMAWPIVVRMVPPDPPLPALPDYTTAAAAPSPPAPAAMDEPPMTAILGDALAYARQSVPTTPPAAPSATASAIPIYDAARDKGTLVVNNLPPKTAGQSYNLWVKTDNSAQPFYVGLLPESSKLGADSIDFSLGSTAIIPSGFVLTRDPQGKPPAPSPQSTILVGPR